MVCVKQSDGARLDRGAWKQLEGARLDRGACEQ